MARSGVVTKTQYFPFGGGLDIVSPALALNPGALLACVNFEPWFSGGYRRIDGYERYDGRAAPSAATFTGFKVSSTANIPAVNSSITDSTSGATGIVCGIDTTNGIIGVTAVSGTFSKGDTLSVTGSPTITSTPENLYAIDDSTSDTWLANAQTYYRNQIGVVPGSGNVLTGHQRGSVVFAIRANAGGTAGVLYQSSASGWTQTGIVMSSYMYFKSGTATSVAFSGSVVQGYSVVTGVPSTAGIAKGDTITDQQGIFPVGTYVLEVGTNTVYLSAAAQGTLVGLQLTAYSSNLPAGGATVTGGTSGATALVHYVIEHGGSTVNSDAYGYLVLTSVSGTFQNGENLKVGGSTFAVAATACTAFALPTTGSYQWLDWNFYGSSSTFCSYVVHGQGPAFEIDAGGSVDQPGSLVVSPILLPLSAVTGQPPSNTPILVEQHLGYLALAFPGGTFVLTVVGQPLTINGFLGAEQFGLGAEITGMLSTVGPALILTTNRNTQALTGTDPATWQLGLIGERMGAQLFTAQKLDSVYAFNSIGITKFTRTLSFGNFAGAVISQMIQPIVQQYLNLSTTSRIVTLYNQYRLYMNDGTFLIMFIPQAGQANMPGVSVAQASNVVAFGMAQYPIVVQNMSVGVDSTGAEQGFFATSTTTNGANGYLYHDLSGTSFDGAAVSAYLRLAFNHVSSPSYRKFFRRGDIEVNATAQIPLSFVADLTYGSSEISSLVEQITVSNVPVINIYGAGGYWDVANWDQFHWDGQNISTARAELSGTGENISFLIFNQGTVAPPFVLQGLVLHFELRRLAR